MLHHYKGKWPKLGERVYIAEGAQIIGDVEIGDHSSIWYNTVIRGDVYYVRIGKHTNIQDGCIDRVFPCQSNGRWPIIGHENVILVLKNNSDGLAWSFFVVDDQ